MQRLAGKDNILQEQFDLVGWPERRTRETHYYLVQSELEIHSSNGVLKSKDVYRELLKVESGNHTGEADRFTCQKFTIQRADAAPVRIPSLDGFSYNVNKDLLDSNGFDQNGQLHSIPEEKFEALQDETGAKLPFDVCYQVYSTFHYYHSYTSFAEPSPQGKGIQDLKKIGDKVILEESFTESPIPGKLAKDKSFWKNGEITLAFNGLSLVNEKICAMLGLDSGVCHWSMPMTYMPLLNLKTAGVSNYQAAIYLDLESKWVCKLEMVLFEITTTTLWGIPVDKSIPVTKLTVKLLTKDEFDHM